MLPVTIIKIYIYATPLLRLSNCYQYTNFLELFSTPQLNIKDIRE